LTLAQASLIYLPVTIVDILSILAIGPSIIASLLRGKRFVIKDGMYYVPCNKRLYESLYIRTVNESYWLELPPENFIIPVS
jgi:hypothetical protein